MPFFFHNELMFEAISCHEVIHSKYLQSEARLELATSRLRSYVDHRARHVFISTPHMSHSSPTYSTCGKCGILGTKWSVETDVDRLDAEIARRLEAMIAPLRRRRNSLLPISRLPDELLLSIFMFCAHEEDEVQPRIKYPQSITPSHVCHAWRQLALSSGRLWCDVSIARPQIARLCLSRSLPHLIHVNWTFEGKEHLVPVKVLGDYLDVFGQTLQDANRIVSVHMHMPQYNSDTRGRLISIVCLAKPRFTCLREFHADFGENRYGLVPDFIDSFFAGGAAQVTYLELRFCQVEFSTLMRMSCLRSLSLVDVSETSRIDGQEWRQLLTSLSESLEALDINAELLYMPADSMSDPSNVVLKRMDHLTLRGFMPDISAALRDLDTLALRRLTLRPDGRSFFEIPNFASEICFQLLFSEQMKVQKAWSLKLHPTGISVCAVDRADIIFSLNTDLEIHSERFSEFLEHLGADMQKRITELCIVEPDESQPDHIQRGISWPPLPWSSLLQYIPNITSLRLNEARFDTLFKANANLVYRYLSVLHLHDMDLLDIHAATDLNQALRQEHRDIQRARPSAKYACRLTAN
jgi:hypothetical protein